MILDGGGEVAEPVPLDRVGANGGGDFGHIHLSNGRVVRWLVRKIPGLELILGQVGVLRDPKFSIAARLSGEPGSNDAVALKKEKDSGRKEKKSKEAED